MVRDKDMDDEVVQAIVKRRVVIMPTLQNSRARSPYRTAGIARLVAEWPGARGDRRGARRKDSRRVWRPHARRRHPPRASATRSCSAASPSSPPHGAHRPRRRHGPAGRSVRLRRASRARADGGGRHVADARNRGGDQHAARTTCASAAPARSRRVSEPTSSSSTPIRSTTSRTRGASRRSFSKGRPVDRDALAAIAARHTMKAVAAAVTIVMLSSASAYAAVVDAVTGTASPSGTRLKCGGRLCRPTGRLSNASAPGGSRITPSPATQRTCPLMPAPADASAIASRRRRRASPHGRLTRIPANCLRLTGEARPAAGSGRRWGDDLEVHRVGHDHDDRDDLPHTVGG